MYIILLITQLIFVRPIASSTTLSSPLFRHALDDFSKEESTPFVHYGKKGSKIAQQSRPHYKDDIEEIDDLSNHKPQKPPGTFPIATPMPTTMKASTTLPDDGELTLPRRMLTTKHRPSVRQRRSSTGAARSSTGDENMAPSGSTAALQETVNSEEEQANQTLIDELLSHCLLRLVSVRENARNVLPRSCDQVSCRVAGDRIKEDWLLEQVTVTYTCETLQSGSVNPQEVRLFSIKCALAVNAKAAKVGSALTEGSATLSRDLNALFFDIFRQFNLPYTQVGR